MKTLQDKIKELEATITSMDAFLDEQAKLMITYTNSLSRLRQRLDALKRTGCDHYEARG